MTSPYTSHFQEAFMAAQGSVALALVALVLFRPSRSWASRLCLVMAIVVAVVAPEVGDFVRGLGYTADHDSFLHVLAASAMLGTVAMALSSPRWLVVAGVVGEVALWKAAHFFTDSDLDLAALHVAWLGALIGLERLCDPVPARPALREDWLRANAGDYVLALIATGLAAVVGNYVLKWHCDSADEWAYTYQAAVFAKLRAYGTRPPCYDAFRSFWVFEKDGRLFSQYTPGWPLFMAPFVAVRALWLAAPASLGLLVLAVARLSRRAAAALVDMNAAGAERQVRVAGTVAAIAVMLSDTILINAGSRFSHVFVCACFAWMVEGVAAITSPIDRAGQTKWGVVTGTAAAFLLATRLVEGGTLGFAVFLYFAYAVARRRVTLRSFVAVLVPFAFFGGLTLVLLRLQLGTWLTTGYSLSDTMYPGWAKATFSVPKPNEWRWSWPLATGAYSWWPLAPSLGLVGMLALLRSRERRVAFLLCFGVLPCLLFYTAIEFGRGWDFGYGPRYQMVAIVPMAVGAGVAFAPLFAAALARAGHAVTAFEGGPAILAAAAALIGAVRIAPLIYPGNTEDIRNRNTVFEAIKADHLANAVVWVGKGTTLSDWLDLTQNMPIDLYGESVFVLRDVSPDIRQCVRESFPGRRWYHTQGRAEVKLVPE